MADDVPRKLPCTQEQRIRNVAVTRAALSSGGATAAARPVPGVRDAARLYRPTLWSQAYSSPGALTAAPGTSQIVNDTGKLLAVTSVHAVVGTAPTGADLILDVKINGSTVFTGGSLTRPTIAAGTTSVTVRPPVPTLFRAGDALTVDIAQVGSTVAGSDLTVQVRATG